MRLTDEVPANTQARIAGALWLAVIITGAFATLTMRQLYMANDPAGTAVRLLASESQFRVAFVVNVISFACYVGVTVILWVLLKPVSRTLALLAAALGVTGVAIGMATSLAQLIPLLLLNGSHLASFTTEQLQGLALTSFLVNTQGALVSWVFFGLQCVIAGYLIARSSFLPRILGVLLAIGGTGYVIGCSMILIFPNIGGKLFPILLGAAFIGEGSLTAWLLAKGVNLAKWNEYSRQPRQAFTR